MCHLVVSAVPDLFDTSIHFFSFIISLIILLFLLPDTFNFHDVVDKYPAHFRLRTLTPWPRTFLPQFVSPTTTSSQRLVTNTPRSPPASSGSLMTSTTSPSARRCLTRAEDKPITLNKKACRPVCRRRQWVMIERGDPLFAHLSRAPKKLGDTTLKVNSYSPGVTKRADSRWPSSRDSKTRIPSWLRPKKYSKFWWNCWFSTRRTSLRPSWSSSPTRSTASSRTSIAAKIEITWSSSKKSQWNGRVKEVSEFYIRHFCKTKISRGSEDYIGTFLLNTRIARWNKLYERFLDFQDAESARSGHSHVANQPVSFPPHPIHSGMLCRSVGMPSHKMGRQAFWDTHVMSGKRFCCKSSTELNPWSSHISQQIHSSQAEKSENQTPDKDQRCQSGPSAKNAVIFSGGDSPKNYGADRSSFRQIHHATNVHLLEVKIQNWGMCLFTIS